MGKPRILVCDDEEIIRKGTKLILGEDYDLVFAEDGDQALAQFKAHQPIDLVILDIKMPGKNGLEVLSELMQTQPPPRVLMLTAYHSVELAQRAAQSFALDYLTKPFERDALRKAVDRALGLPEWQRSPRQPEA